MKNSVRVFVSKTGQNGVSVKTATTCTKDDVVIIEDGHHNAVFIDVSVCVDALQLCAKFRGMKTQEYIESVLKVEEENASNKE